MPPGSTLTGKFDDGPFAPLLDLIVYLALFLQDLYKRRDPFRTPTTL